MIGPRTLAAAAATLAAIPSAAAQEQGQLIQFQLMLPQDDDPEDFVIVTNEVEIRRFFNRARCECSSDFAVELFIPNASSAPEGEAVEIFVGNNCDDIELQAMQCTRVATIADVRDLRNRRVERISVRDLADPDGECPVVEVERRVFALIDFEGDGIYEYNDSVPIALDLQPPPEPIELVAQGAEEGVSLDWELSDTRIDDFEFFQALCVRADNGAPGRADPDEARFETADTVCGDFAPGAAPRVGGGLDGGLDAGSGDAGTDPGAGELDPAAVCGTATAPSTSLRVDDLENGVDYEITWIGIDPAGNPTPVFAGVVTPQPVIDLWEDYKNSGGGAEGGFCFVATATFGSYDHPYVVVLRDFRDHTLARFGAGRWLIRTYYDLSPPIARLIEDSAVARVVAMALLLPVVAVTAIWEYTGWLAKLGLVVAFLLFRRLRRMRRGDGAGADAAPERRSPRRRVALAAAAGVALVLALAGSASAQTWFDELDEEPPREPVPEDVKWNFELKVGPYVPGVDDEFDGEGPFERMFGDGPFVMTQIALDRFFLWPEGQLGVSVGLGFLTKGADAFQVDSATGGIAMDENGQPIRVDGETTHFRMIPTHLSAIYRLTALDDRWRVPLVPYGRLGLSYYLWWITRPDGSISEADGEEARGGSLGWQGSVGLAIRAERLDPDAGVNLRNELGIEHAGFFAELTFADVDGFGAGDKLSLGDLTWFGGINFEF